MHETKTDDLSVNRIVLMTVLSEDSGESSESHLSTHLLREWSDLTFHEIETEAKLVSDSQASCEAGTGEDRRGRQSRNAVEGKPELVTDIRAHIEFIKERCAYSSCSSAKYTDEYPTHSVESLKALFDRLNLDQDNRWIRLPDFIEKQKGKVILKSQVESVYRLLVDIVVTLVLYGYVEERGVLIARLDQVFVQWLRMLKELDFNFLKLAKYKLAAFAAYAKQSSMMPKTPFSEEFIQCNAYSRPDYIFDGTFRSFFRRLITEQSTTVEKLFFMSLVDSICRGTKKGSDRPTDQDVHKANLATMDCFTDDRDYKSLANISFPEKMEPFVVVGNKVLTGLSSGNSEGIKVSLDYEVLRTVDEIVPPGSVDYQPSWHRMPSLSACYENPYASGGAMFTVKQRLEGNTLDTPQALHRLYAKVSTGMARDKLPELIAPVDASDPQPVKTFREFGSSHDYCLDYLEFSTNYDNLADPNDIDEIVRAEAWAHQFAVDVDMGSSGVGRLPRMAILGLKEALKIRGITKGEALENWLLQPLQKYLALRLKKLPCFAVTGRPLHEDDLTQLFSSIAHGEKFLSGDYDNATNKMFSHFTELAARRVCENLSLSPDWTQIIVDSLVNNVVVYQYWDPLERVVKKIMRLQKNAQPMGKILSFVFLCIINAAVCRKAVEVDTGNAWFRCKLKHFKGLINGDDCCFILRDFHSWEHTSRSVGLENSIGKTFFSEKFIEMNSRSFVIDTDHSDFIVLPSGDRLGLHFRQTPFINFGLMKGMVRSTSQVEDTIRFERFCCLGDCHQDLCKGLPFLYRELDFLFKRYNRDLLESRDLDGIPYYVPKWLGGLGMCAGPDPRAQISQIERRQAQIIADQLFEVNRTVKYVGNARTCLVHEKVSEILDGLMEAAGISKVPFENLELNNGEVVSLAKENQKVYTQLVERVWKSVRPSILKTDIEDGSVLEIPQWAQQEELLASRRIESKSDLQLLLNKRQIKTRLRNNSRLWKKSFVLALAHPNLGCLPWFRFWGDSQKQFYPLVVADAVRDMRWRIAEL